MTNADIERMPYTLNAQQVAEILGIAKNSAYTLMHSEGFPTLHIGRRLVVPKEKLLQWMDDQLEQEKFQPGFDPTGIFSRKGLKNRESYVNNRSEKHNALRKGVILAKKRCNGEGSINKRKDGRWECSIMFGFQKDGRRRRKSFYGRTRKEALDKMHDFKQKLEAGLITLDERPLVQPDILFSQWADTWYEGHKDSISKTTQQSYKYTLATLKEKIGDRPVNTIKAMDIEDLLRDLRKEGKSDSYVAKARGMLFQIMNKAEANELIRRNPVACAEKMKANKPMEAKEAFTAEEVKRMMEGLPHDKYGDSIRLMLGTGIRMQELLALEPRLIEEDGSAIHIRQAVKTVSGRVEIGPPKSRDSLRDVPIPEGMRPMVISLRETKDTYLFQSPNKEQPFDPKHYRDKFKDYIEALGDVRVLTPHSCRHTYVSQLQALGVDLATIQSMVGHADLDMTQHYLHVQSPIKQKAVEAFNAAFCGNDPHSSQIPVGPK